MTSNITLKAEAVEFANSNDYDAVIYINDNLVSNINCAVIDKVHTALRDFQKVHKNVAKEVTVVPFPAHASGRMVFSPVVSLNKDQDDIRRVYEAANAGVKKALSMDCNKLYLVVGPMITAPKEEKWAEKRVILLNAVLGAYHALYQPVEIREAFPSRTFKASKFAVLTNDKELLDTAYALEDGRRVARDIAGSDPERMAAPRIADYLQEEFRHHADTIEMFTEEVDRQKYPLMAAVNRAAETVPRHAGRVVKLLYKGANATENIFLVGKGITYDTGGADIKANGVMSGMHRDKGGAAGVAGFMKMLALLKPAGIAVHAKMAYVRNSVGEDCYVADEIITARSGKRVRVGNTDAEGRMVMTDLICEAKEEALNVPNPSIFTWATLTGHVIRAYGEDYLAVMDNGPARAKNTSQELKASSELISDLAEISTIRREDYLFNKGKTECEDLLQSNDLPSTLTARGHQAPAAFMILASGLDKHGKDSEKPIPYTHVDVAGSSGSKTVQPTASPSLMFAARYILPRLKIF